MCRKAGLACCEEVEDATGNLVAGLEDRRGWRLAGARRPGSQGPGSHPANTANAARWSNPNIDGNPLGKQARDDVVVNQFGQPSRQPVPRPGRHGAFEDSEFTHGLPMTRSRWLLAKELSGK